MEKFLFLLFSFLSISITYSFVCEENVNHCLKCNELTNICLRCDLDIYIPDSKGGFKNANHCKNGKNYCLECNEEENICQTCDVGYFPDENGGCSYTQNCLISYKGECLQCSENYILIGNKTEEENGFKFCKYNSSIDFINCKTINRSTGFCDECEEDFYLNMGDRRCTKTKNCYESIYGICSQCNPGFYLNKKEEKCKRKEYPFILCKETVDGENCEKCDDDSFMAEDGQCVDSNYCSLSYKTKLSCKECKKNYFLTKNKRACSNTKNCENADKETGLCEKCTEGNYLTKNRKCESNKEDIFKNCKIAKEDYCTECEWGYYLSEDDQCTPSPNCTEALDGICVSCNDNYFLGEDNICTTVEHCARSDYYKNCVECKENYYFDLSDKTCKKAKDQFSNCLESNSLGEKCLICRNNYYLSSIDNLCYSNEEKGTFYKCAMSTMDGKLCSQCIQGYYTGLKDYKCTKAYVCLYSDEDHHCQECRDDYCLNKNNGKCYINYEIKNNEKLYFKCLNTDEDGKVCKKCVENYQVGENGLCINLNDCEDPKNETCDKCKEKDYEDNFLCANKYFGCVETLAENCLRCDDLYDLNTCTECNEGYILDDNDKCVKL